MGLVVVVRRGCEGFGGEKSEICDSKTDFDGI